MAREIDGKLRVAADSWGDFAFSIATGKIAGVSSRIQYGRNLDVDTTSEDIWAADGVMAYPSSATTLSAVSSSANDTALTGTGARTLEVEYLDGDYNTVIKEVALDGITPVVVATDYLRVQDIHIKTAGSLKVAAGNITLSYTGGNVVGVIKAGRVDTENTHFTVPAGFSAYLTGGTISAGKSSDATVDFQARDSQNGGVFRTGQEVIVSESVVSINLPIYQKIPEKWDIRIQGRSTQGNSSVSVAYYLILVQENLYPNN